MSCIHLQTSDQSGAGVRDELCQPCFRSTCQYFFNLLNSETETRPWLAVASCELLSRPDLPSLTHIAPKCYFLDSASPATPIVYYVERLRQGRSYVACSVKAVQNGSIIFILMCSFQKPEPWQPSHHWKMPDVPGPDECELEEDRYALALKQDNLPPAMRDFFEEYRVVSSLFGS